MLILPIGNINIAGAGVERHDVCHARQGFTFPVSLFLINPGSELNDHSMHFLNGLRSGGGIEEFSA